MTLLMGAAAVGMTRTATRRHNPLLLLLLQKLRRRLPRRLPNFNFNPALISPCVSPSHRTLEQRRPNFNLVRRRAQRSCPCAA